jgi:ankyrin repeat protein
LHQFSYLHNYRDEEGETPLAIASQDHTNTELVKILLEAGVDANPSKKEGKVCH